MELLRVVIQEAFNWSAFIQGLLETVLTVAAPILVTMLSLWLRKLAVKAQAELDSEQLAFIMALARQFVVAAEQSGLSGQIKNLGAEKKEYVINLLEEAARKNGIDLDVDALSAIIEAAVADEFGLSEDEEVKEVLFPRPYNLSEPE